MIQFITNHPIWTSVILYLIIGFLQGVQYYLLFTWKELQEVKQAYSTYSKQVILNENFGRALIHIPLWFLFLISDTYDLYVSINYTFIKEEDRDTSKDWPENY